MVAKRHYRTHLRALGAAVFLALCGVAPAAAQSDGGVDPDLLAKELANPGGALSSMNNKLEVRWYDGKLPGAGDQQSYTYVFQPVLPFPTASGDTVIFRPAFNFLLDQPFFDAETGTFKKLDGFGNINYDLLYSFGNIDPYVFGVGLVGAFPTASGDRIAIKEWLLGPEVIAAKKFDWGIAGLFFFQQWDIEHQGTDFNVSSLQPLLAYSLGSGVTIGPSGTITYDWNASSGNEWTVPVGLNIGKTTTLGNLPIKYSVALEYNVVRPKNFGPEWKATFSITPVTRNPFLRKR
ncbi:MAG: hypothetical protein GY798_33990 [Hyphomicrobiales bacterium]|nr:hypothetical protein [Hyphomicrobiales bacterium]